MKLMSKFMLPVTSLLAAVYLLTMLGVASCVAVFCGDEPMDKQGAVKDLDFPLFDNQCPPPSGGGSFFSHHRQPHLHRAGISLL